MTKTLELNQILLFISMDAKSETIRQEILGLEPMTERFLIEKALDEVQDMVRLISKVGVLPLIEDYDIHQLLKYAELGRVFSVHELLVIRLFLSMEKDILNYFKETEKQKVSLQSLFAYYETMHNHQVILAYINQKMDVDGQIYDDATPDLLHIRKDLNRLDKQLQERLQRLLVDYSSYLNESVIVMRNDRFCIPVKDAFKNKIKGVVHDISASKQTVYIEPESTRNVTAQIEQLKILEEQEIHKIIANLSSLIHQEIETLKNNLDLFLALDFISAKAKYAMKTNAVKPNINENGRIKLMRARHPLLDPKSVVAIDVELNEQIKTLLITGPNTGGKTVALKTVGLLTLMMQCGLLIPAHEETDLAIFDQVFADIGDEQSIMQSLSTFSSHLTKIISMLEKLKNNTLVLLDEIGSGTDPNEGVSLAIAILNSFRQHDVRMMVTTHYSELKSYAYEEDHMMTASVAFDKKTLKPLYYLQMGTTGSSHAFLIAKRLGLTDDVVKKAENIYKGRQTNLAKIMEKLNDEMLYLEQQKKKLYEEIDASKIAKQGFLDAKSKLMMEQDRILVQTKAKEEEKWNLLKLEARKLIEELQSKDKLSKPELAAYKHQLNQSGDDEKISFYDDELSVGDEVYIIPYQQNGIIKAIKNNEYRVLFGHFDLYFRPSDLRKEEKKMDTKKVIKSVKTIGQTPERIASFEVDLRGFRFDDVKDELDQAIDRALLSGLHSLRIIHGFGSGAVRKAVYDYIKSSPYIKTSRFGGEGEGLNGVTIITLK